MASLAVVGVGQVEGSISFRESVWFFADNGLGSGSEVEIMSKVGNEPAQVMKARITWRDWNWFDYVEV